MQLLDLRHHRIVYREPACGVDDQHVVVMPLRIVQRGQRDVLRLLADVGGEEIYLQLFRQRVQLLDRRRAIHVAADQQHLLLVLVAQQLGELAAGGGLARALQTGHQDHGGRHGGEIERVVVFAHQPGELAVHHADQGLPRVQVGYDFLAERGLFDLGDEFLDHRQRNVGLEQGHAHFAQGILDVAFGQARLAAQSLDDAGKALCEVVQHGCFKSLV